MNLAKPAAVGTASVPVVIIRPWNRRHIARVSNHLTNHLLRKTEDAMRWTTPVLEEICIGLEINGYLPAEL
jgi:coenzyme PQQ precursor peptide PqqA